MAAIARIEALAARYGAFDAFERVPGWLYAEHEAGAELVDRELAASLDAGLAVSAEENVPLPFPVARAIRYDDQGQLDAGLYLDTLARAAAVLGVRIYERSRVLAAEDAATCVLHLESGAEVRAQRVIFCTHAAVDRFFLQAKVAPYISYVVAYDAPRHCAPGLFWDTADPYHYVRSAERDGRTYLLVGGGDHRTGTQTDTEKQYAALEKYAFDHFGLRAPRYRWASQVEEPIDGLPFVGPRLTGHNVLFATGFSGNGLTFGTVAATILSDRVLGRENAWADLYAATRIKPVASAKAFVTESAPMMVHFARDWVTPAEARSVEDVPPGEGRIVRVRGKRLAVYRAPHGALTAVSPICTHLGCHVHFNSAERTWDCPCHGSRYAVDGTVVHGPATRPLAPREIGEPLTPVAPSIDEELFDPELRRT
jgi:glycine/D-amino acid oxidase-like deaminating enzyme/nitrite reductase/ring-hydroxylating ferredoxin subunit